LEAVAEHNIWGGLSGGGVFEISNIGQSPRYLGSVNTGSYVIRTKNNRGSGATLEFVAAYTPADLVWNLLDSVVKPDTPIVYSPETPAECQLLKRPELFFGASASSPALLR